MPPGREPRLGKIGRDLAAAEERVFREHPVIPPKNGCVEN